MSPMTVLKIVGLIIVGVVCWKYLALWGLVLACGIAMVVLS